MALGVYPVISSIALRFLVLVGYSLFRVQRSCASNTRKNDEDVTFPNLPTELPQSPGASFHECPIVHLDNHECPIVHFDHDQNDTNARSSTLTIMNARSSTLTIDASMLAREFSLCSACIFACSNTTVSDESRVDGDGEDLGIASDSDWSCVGENVAVFKI